MYCGLTSFNARARAANFTPDELHDVVTYCHDRGVRVFVTLNVLIFEQELPDAERTIRAIATAGADAVIVQDVGLVELVRRVAPNLRIHGSTQMSITSGNLHHPPPADVNGSGAAHQHAHPVPHVLAAGIVQHQR